MEVLFVFVWIVLSGVAAGVASGRGRGGLNWFLIALLLTGPVIALVIVSSIERLGDGNSGYRPRTEEDDHYGRYAERLRRGTGF